MSDLRYFKTNNQRYTNVVGCITKLDFAYFQPNMNGYTTLSKRVLQRC